MLLNHFCTACHHVALLTPDALQRLGLEPGARVLDLKDRLRCRGCGRKGRAGVSVEWRDEGLASDGVHAAGPCFEP